MSSGGWIAICVVCAVVGAVLTYILLSKKITNISKENVRLLSEIESEQRINVKAEEEKQQQQEKIDELNEKLRLKIEESAKKSQEAESEISIKHRLQEEKAELLMKNEELNKRLNEVTANYSAEYEKNKWINNADEKLREAFSTISKDIIDKNNNLFLTQANDKLSDFANSLGQKMAGERKEMSNVINPVGEQLEALKKQVAEMEKERLSAYSGLNTSVDELKKQNDILKEETRSLSGALRNSTVRGKWGEAQLRRIVELSGMVEHIDFEEQHVNDDGKRPDMLVKLAGNRSVPIDSKVPMDEYLQYVDSKELADRKSHLDSHIKAVKKHIDALCKKEYWKSDERSVPFVVMVMPYESGLSATFEGDSNIFQYAVEKNVLLLSPMTFYAFLKSVSMGWTERNVAENAKAIKNLSDELIERFSNVWKHMEAVGDSMTKASQNYNKAVNSYNSRLLPTFNKIKALKSEYESTEIELIDENISVISKNEA